MRTPSAVPRTGWPLREIATIEAYRDAPARYTFPTLDELRASLHGLFEMAEPHWPGYALGHCCPLLSLRPLPAPAGAAS